VVETDTSNFTKTDAGRAVTLGLQELKRVAQADDIGGAVAFLTSDAARRIAGETLHVDGGSKLSIRKSDPVCDLAGKSFWNAAHAWRHARGLHRRDPDALRPVSRT
jgi:hypothetical protein